MNKKRTLLTVVALLLVCVMSVVGTIAYLKSNTTTVTNTFVAAGGTGPFIDDDPGSEDPAKKLFEIKEYEVTQSSSGKYTMTTTEVDGQTYAGVMPGTNIPKQAFVKLSRTSGSKTETVDGQEVVTEIKPAPAYLYLEVVDALPAAYSWEIEDTNWELITGLEGVQGGKVYLYVGSLADSAHVITNIAAYDANMIDIIKEDKIFVDKDATLDAAAVTLSFNAYLAQAAIGETDDPAAVFTACFK